MSDYKYKIVAKSCEGESNYTMAKLVLEFDFIDDAHNCLALALNSILDITEEEGDGLCHVIIR